MRRIIRYALLLCAAGLIAATGATAGSLITGAKIKDGSLAEKDLNRKARAKLNRKAGTRGPQGPKGESSVTVVTNVGPQGPPGKNGANGANGADGQSGPEIIERRMDGGPIPQHLVNTNTGIRTYSYDDDFIADRNTKYLLTLEGTLEMTGSDVTCIVDVDQNDASYVLVLEAQNTANDVMVVPVHMEATFKTPENSQKYIGNVTCQRINRGTGSVHAVTFRNIKVTAMEVQ